VFVRTLCCRASTPKPYFCNFLSPCASGRIRTLALRIIYYPCATKHNLVPLNLGYFVDCCTSCALDPLTWVYHSALNEQLNNLNNTIIQNLISTKKNLLNPICDNVLLVFYITQALYSYAAISMLYWHVNLPTPECLQDRVAFC
jgi:hypothetical protein